MRSEGKSLESHSTMALDCGKVLSVGIVYGSWHPDLLSGLLQSANSEFFNCGGDSSGVSTYEIPGCFEIGLALRSIHAAKAHDIYLALGVILEGQTDHFTQVSSAVTSGISTFSWENMVPVGYGVVAAPNLEVARARCFGEHSRGGEAMLAALRMYHFQKGLL